MLEEARGNDASFVALEARLHAFTTDRRSEFAGFFSLALSSLVSMLRLAAFFASRIADEGERHAFFLRFLDEYLERAVVPGGRGGGAAPPVRKRRGRQKGRRFRRLRLRPASPGRRVGIA